MTKATAKTSMRAPKVKTFNLHWGSRIVEKEAVIETPYHKLREALHKLRDRAAV